LTSTPTESETIASAAHAVATSNHTPSSDGDTDTPSESQDTSNQGKKRTAAAAASLAKQAVKMRKAVTAEAQQDLPVGAVVLLPIDKVDCSKVCLKRLPCIVADCVHDKYWLACITGFLDMCLAQQGFKHEPDKTPVFYEEELQNWKYFGVISLPTVSAANSMVGG
jgi:hypothetical protein